MPVIYYRVSRSLKERAEMLQNSRYSSLAAPIKSSMCKEPSEGQVLYETLFPKYWQHQSYEAAGLFCSHCIACEQIAAK